MLIIILRKNYDFFLILMDQAQLINQLALLLYIKCPIEGYDLIWTQECILRPNQGGGSFLLLFKEVRKWRPPHLSQTNEMNGLLLLLSTPNIYSPSHKETFKAREKRFYISLIYHLLLNLYTGKKKKEKGTPKQVKMSKLKDQNSIYLTLFFTCAKGIWSETRKTVSEGIPVESGLSSSPGISLLPFPVHTAVEDISSPITTRYPLQSLEDTNRAALVSR